jgi:hypothetical protein
MMKRPELVGLDQQAILKLADYANDLVIEHHGKPRDAMQMVDYLAVTMLEVFASGVHKADASTRTEAFDRLGQNLARMVAAWKERVDAGQP